MHVCTLQNYYESKFEVLEGKPKAVEDEQVDYIDHYASSEPEEKATPEPQKHVYDFEKESSASTGEEEEEEQELQPSPPNSPVAMAAEQVTDGIEKLSTKVIGSW